MQRLETMLRPERADDAGYFRTRALQEQVAAQGATSDVARRRHEELAMLYRFRSMMQPPEDAPTA